MVDAIVEELDGASECIVTQLLLHEAAHNYRYKTTDPFQHGGVHLQRVRRGASDTSAVVFFFIYFGFCIKSNALTGVILDAIYQNKLTLVRSHTGVPRRDMRETKRRGTNLRKVAIIAMSYEDKRQRKNTRGVRSRSLERSCSVAARAALAWCERSGSVQQQARTPPSCFSLHEGAVLGASLRAQRGGLKLKSSIRVKLALGQDTPSSVRSLCSLACLGAAAPAASAESLFPF